MLNLLVDYVTSFGDNGGTWVCSRASGLKCENVLVLAFRHSDVRSSHRMDTVEDREQIVKLNHARGLAMDLPDLIDLAVAVPCSSVHLLELPPYLNLLLGIPASHIDISLRSISSEVGSSLSTIPKNEDGSVSFKLPY